MAEEHELPTTSAGRRANMRAIRSRDTTPELAVRRLLHRRGLRYRVNFRPLPTLRRTADVVFTSTRVAVFIDGCYWHGCPEHSHPLGRNADYWGPKLEGNRARDADTVERLSAEGWTVMRFWEHEDPASVADAIEALVRGTSKVGWQPLGSGARASGPSRAASRPGERRVAPDTGPVATRRLPGP